MKFKDCKFTPKNRRGLSSVVGALLFVVLMVATFAVLGVALDSQTDIVSTSRDVADKNLKKQQEDFDLVSINQPLSDNLEVTLVNNGQNEAEMFTLVMTNKSDPGEPTITFEIPSETSFLAPGTTDQSGEPTDIVETSDITLDIPAPGSVERYNFKVVSSLGTIKKLTIDCSGDTQTCGPVAGPVGTGTLSSQLFLDGPTGVNGKTSTVIMFVQNTGDASVYNLTPTRDCDTMTTEPPFGTFSPCALDPPSIPQLTPGSLALFKWDGVVGCDIDDVFTMENAVGGFEADLITPVTPSDPDSDTLTCIDPNDCGPGGCGGGEGDDDPLDEKFITRPELFLTIPSPFGGPGTPVGGFGDPDRALWGANVVNPTDTTMFIHKITITAFPPAANKNFLVVASGVDPHVCNPRDISPGNGTIPGTSAQEAGFWSCPGQNTIMWRNYASPIVLPPQSTYPFLVQLESDRPISNVAESVLVDSTVYTTSGSFGKGNYQSTAYPEALYANVFGTTDWLDPLNHTKIISSVSDIPSNSTQRFHIVLTDYDTDEETFINAGSKIVVNVPRAFTNVTTVMTESVGILDIPNANATLAEPSVVIHPDKTTQIIATVPGQIGDIIGLESVVLSFDAQAPVVTKEKLMVMYTLANGEGTNSDDESVSVGPLSEIILVVVP